MNLIKNVSDERKRVRMKRSSHHHRHEYCSSDNIDEEEISLSLDPKKEAQKKERMLRNRESAALSRKRKREHTEKLEEKISALTTENNELRERLKQYECSFGVVPANMHQITSSRDELNMKRRPPLPVHHPMNLVPVRGDPKIVLHANDMRNNNHRIPPAGIHENDSSTTGCFNREFAAPANSTTKVESL